MENQQPSEQDHNSSPVQEESTSDQPLALGESSFDGVPIQDSVAEASAAVQINDQPLWGIIDVQQVDEGTDECPTEGAETEENKQQTINAGNVISSALMPEKPPGSKKKSGKKLAPSSSKKSSKKKNTSPQKAAPIAEGEIAQISSNKKQRASSRSNSQKSMGSNKSTTNADRPRSESPNDDEAATSSQGPPKSSKRTLKKQSKSIPIEPYLNTADQADEEDGALDDPEEESKGVQQNEEDYFNDELEQQRETQQPKIPSENLSNGIVSTEQEDAQKSGEESPGRAEMQPSQINCQREDGETPGLKSIGNAPDSCLSRNRHFESSDEDDYPGNTATEWEIIVPAQQRKLDEAIEKQLTELLELHPPNPILPKSQRPSEPPRSGGGQQFMRLMKFRGQDYGKSEFRKRELNIDAIKFPTDTTLKAIFTPSAQPPEGEAAAGFWQGKPNKQGAIARNYQALAKASQKGDKKEFPDKFPGVAVGSGPGQQQPPQLNENLTPFGEIVYLRWALDFNTKKNSSKRDTVVEENLLDVKRLLKASAMAAAEQKSKEADKTEADTEKKALMQVTVDPYYASKGPDDTTLIFESRFESGNLASALKVKDKENDYLLLLQNDVNTGGHTQWYFFRTTNKIPGEVRFNMLNLCKPDSLYNEGMKILVYSEKKAAQRDIGWHRAGQKIYYYANGVRKDNDRKSTGGQYKSYYTHTFTYDFEYPEDTVYFAYCYPYTYTDMLEDLNKISSDQVKQHFVQRKTLCETLAGNKCEILTITSKMNQENMHKRKGVIITARVHPGESVGSWMMKGALDFLTDTTSPEAELLRQNYVFKVIPMLNPDGVINGNYRCSLAGCDLNRRWKAPSKVLHPTIYYTKQLIFQFAKERELAVFCDFHGHSRRKNIFMYGCNVPGSPEDSRLFPFILSNLCPFFIYNNCRFGNQKSKESTARMSLFNELRQHPAIYTMESSFCGNDVGPFARYHFSTDNLTQTGTDFCRSLLIYNQIPAPFSILEGLLKNINGIFSHYKVINDKLQFVDKDHDVELMKLYHERLETMHTNNIPINTKQIRKALLNVLRQHSDVVSDGENTSSAGSDNAPSEDNLQLEEIAEVVPIEQDPQLAAKQRKKAFDNAEGLKGDLNMLASQAKKQYKLANPDKLKKGKKRKGGDVDSHKNSANGSDEEDKVDVEKADEKPENVGEETAHKKKLKKNVESRDACTQTDRSDYMLIKQRQRQREAFQLLASQGERLNAQGQPVKNPDGSQPPVPPQQPTPQMAAPPSASNQQQPMQQLPGSKQQNQNIKQARGSKQYSRQQIHNQQNSFQQEAGTQPPQPHKQDKKQNQQHLPTRAAVSNMQQHVPPNMVQAPQQASLESVGQSNNRQLVYMRQQPQGMQQQPIVKQQVAAKSKGVAPTQTINTMQQQQMSPPQNTQQFSALHQSQQNSYNYPTNPSTQPSGPINNHFGLTADPSPRQQSQAQSYPPNQAPQLATQQPGSQNAFSPQKTRRNIRKVKQGSEPNSVSTVGNLSNSQSVTNTTAQSQPQAQYSDIPPQFAANQHQPNPTQPQKASWERVIVSSSSRAANSAISQWLIQKSREAQGGQAAAYQHGTPNTYGPSNFSQNTVQPGKTSATKKAHMTNSSMAAAGNNVPYGYQPQTKGPNTQSSQAARTTQNLNMVGSQPSSNSVGQHSHQQVNYVVVEPQQQIVYTGQQHIQERQVTGNQRYMGQRGAAQYGLQQPQTAQGGGLPHIVQQTVSPDGAMPLNSRAKVQGKSAQINNMALSQQQRKNQANMIQTNSSLTPNQQKNASGGGSSQQQVRASTAGRSERVQSNRGGTGAAQYLHQSGNFSLHQMGYPQNQPIPDGAIHPISQHHNSNAVPNTDHRNKHQAILRTNSLEGLSGNAGQVVTSTKKPPASYTAKEGNTLRNSSNGFMRAQIPIDQQFPPNGNTFIDVGARGPTSNERSGGPVLQNQFIQQQMEQRQQAQNKLKTFDGSLIQENNVQLQQPRVLSSNSTKKPPTTVSPVKQQVNLIQPRQQEKNKQQLIQVQRIVPQNNAAPNEPHHQQQHRHSASITQGQTHSSHQSKQSYSNAHSNVQQQASTPGKQGVRINIVNVHNEFNIQNNIIIQQQPPSGQPQQEQYVPQTDSTQYQPQQNSSQKQPTPVQNQSRKGTAPQGQRPNSKQRPKGAQGSAAKF